MEACTNTKRNHLDSYIRYATSCGTFADNKYKIKTAPSQRAAQGLPIYLDFNYVD